MEILINEEKIDLKLEENACLGEIIGILNEELAKAQMVIVDILLNKERINPVEKKDILVKEIELLEIKALGAGDLAIESLTEIGKYIPRAIKGIGGINDLLKEGKDREAGQRAAQLAEGLSWIVNVLKKSGFVLKLDYVSIYLTEEKATVLEKIEALEKEGRSLQNGLKELNWQGIEKVLDELIPLLSSWINILPKLLQDYSKKEGVKILKEEAGAAGILRELKESKEELLKLSKELEDISIRMQTGNEYEAMESLQECTRTLENIFGMLKKAQNFFNLNYSRIKVEKEDVAGKIEEIKDILSEVVTAFENNDLVLLADLLEYELSPLMSRFPEVIDCVLSRIKREIH
ncbi:hypothetical protein KKC52_11430 [bacterium]|nr:hypothetical protein [bacterium]